MGLVWQKSQLNYCLSYRFSRSQELFYTYLEMTIFTVKPGNLLFLVLCTTVHSRHTTPENPYFYFYDGSDSVIIRLWWFWPAVLVTQTGSKLFIPYYLEIKLNIMLNVSFPTKNHPIHFNLRKHSFMRLFLQLQSYSQTLTSFSRNRDWFPWKMFFQVHCDLLSPSKSECYKNI